MMKKIYFLLLVLFGLNVNAQIVNIPDANFKAKLLSASSSNQIASTQTPDIYGNVSIYTKIDTNNNGEIENSELSLITYLNVSFSSIVNLAGIDYFTNLISLKCNHNQLTELNFNQNLNLKYLVCSVNQLSILDISQNTNLVHLYCQNNQLTSLDLTQKLDLRILSFDSNNLTALDISENPILVNLSCNNNQLTNLDVSQNQNLESLSFLENQLSFLDLSQNVDLEYLNCRNNQFATINLSQNINLIHLYCQGNQLTNLDVSQNQLLEHIECNNNQLTNLEFTQNPNLQILKCGSNQLNDLNVALNPNLQFLNCYSNLLTSLDLTLNSNLSGLFCENNQLLSLFVKNNNQFWNNLTFSNNPNLQYICADDEDITIVQQKIVDYGYTNCHVNSYCSFTPGGTFYDITGNTKYDFNSNGCDISDVNFSNLKFSINNGTNTGSLISYQSGNYSIPVQSGSHTITPNLENPTYFNISPPSFTVNFPTQGSPFTQNFCVTANGVKSDVEVVILPTVPARPGFDAKYKISYRNKGNQIESGSVSLTFEDTVLDYVSSNPVSNSQATNSYTWNYSNLQPFETREIEVVFNVNSPTETPAVNIADVLNYNATITTSNTDETPNDNAFTLNQTVVGSYDPNDKTCLEGETVGPNMIGEYVHYLIRFENTGTYPAENVVVKDMIDLTKFDLATLIPLKGSHDFYTRIKDNKVEFIFENINLDFNDATNDGYVAFKIKTKSNLFVGDTFSNDANIYFDYNFPITTNTYTTTIQALSTQDFDFGNQFTLYPNPVKEVLNFNSKENLDIKSVEIYNMLGQIVLVVPNATTSIDVSSLTKGNYFVKVNTEKGSANTKFIKE